MGGGLEVGEGSRSAQITGGPRRGGATSGNGCCGGALSRTVRFVGIQLAGRRAQDDGSCEDWRPHRRRERRATRASEGGCEAAVEGLQRRVLIIAAWHHTASVCQRQNLKEAPLGLSCALSATCTADWTEQSVQPRWHLTAALIVGSRNDVNPDKEESQAGAADMWTCGQMYPPRCRLAGGTGQRLNARWPACHLWRSEIRTKPYHTKCTTITTPLQDNTRGQAHSLDRTRP